MPQIPDRRALGPLRINGAAAPPQINPNVAYDIGRAGAAYARAFEEIGQAFAGLGAKAQAMEDNTWLANAKIATLEADDAIRRDTELNAGVDGSGYEQAPAKFNEAVKGIEERPGGSQEARTKYKLWSAEQGYQTGAWAANSAQTRLKNSTLERLDTRAETLSGLASSNPERAEEYMSAYEEEVRSYTGYAISSVDADARIRQTRSNLGRSALVAKAIKNPEDFGKALRGLESSEAQPSEANTLYGAMEQVESTGDPNAESPKGAAGIMQVMPATAREIAGELGEANVAKMSDQEIKAFLKSPEAGRRYGRHYFNQMLKRYDGDKEAALIAYNGGPSRADAWLKAGRDDAVIPKESANYYKKVLGQAGAGGGGSTGTTKGGIYQTEGLKIVDKVSSTAPYSKAAVKPFQGIVLHHTASEAGAEQMVQYGHSVDSARGGSFGYHFYIDRDGTILQGAPMDKRTNHVKNPEHRQRKDDTGLSNSNAIGISLVGKGGDETPAQVDAAAKLVNSLQKTYNIGQAKIVGHGELQNDRQHNEGEAVLRAIRGGAPVMLEKREVPASVDLKSLPTVDGTIQPAEIMSLSPEDRGKVTRELRPYLQEELKNKMTDALSALQATGQQNVITEAQLDNYTPLIGPKLANDWKHALREGRELYTIQKAANAMGPEERNTKLRELVPTGNPNDLAGEERVRFDMWSKAFNQMQKSIKEDPLQYFSMNNESGRQAMKVISEAPRGEAGKKQREQAFSTLLSLQQREGLPTSDIKLMGQAQAQSYVNALRDTKSGPAAALIVDDLRTTFGEHFDRVWGHLVAEGAPTTYLAMPMATRTGQNALVDAFSMRKSMLEGAGKETNSSNVMRMAAGVTEKDLKKTIASETAEFTGALGGRVGGDRLVVAFRDAVEMVALKYVIEGKPLDDAVRQATDELYRKNISVHQGVIIPKDRDEQMGDAIRYGMAEGYRGELPSEYILDPFMRDKRYGPAFNHDSYMRSLQNNVRWLSNDELTGAYLIDEFGQHVMYDNGSELTPVFYSWDDFKVMFDKRDIAKTNPYRVPN